ncbi:NfeD family protein [Rhodohalobacter sp. 8-1]|uniref:NfeD family protein n=1 Tax=Rhodohalobacter sp. 8-1 TaxID=3131972 RepID=UPI0030EBB618
MDADFLTWVFLGGGLLLMILELAIPGGVAFFLGISGIIVGVLRFLDLITSTGGSVAAWLILSVGLTIAIRPFIKKYLRPESSFKYADEDYEAMDQVAEVIEEVNEYDNSGKIRFDGTSWRAKSLDGTIKPGAKVRIRYRENITWIVEAEGVKEPSKEQLKNLSRN